MSNKEVHRSKCLTEEQLSILAYSQGAHPMETQWYKHIEECEICADMLEGMKLTSKDSFNESIESINQKIDERLLKETNKGRGVPLTRWLAVAASFLILMSLAVLINHFMQPDEKELAGTLNSEEITHPEIKPQQMSPSVKSNTLYITPDISNHNELKPDESSPSATSTLPPTPPPPEMKGTLSSVNEGNTITAPTQPSHETAFSDNISVEDYRIPPPIVDEEPIKTESSTTVVESDALSINKKHSNKKDISAKSEEVTPQLILSESYNDSLNLNKQQAPEELLITAKKLLQQKKYEQSISLCNQIISQPDSKLAYRDDALLVKANCLLLQGKSKQGKDILNDLIQSNSKKKEEAQHLLDKY